MKTHYSEADLLETYYMQPGESMPVMMHLADCTLCAQKYERLERKLREAAACSTHEERAESFWARQRMSVMRRVATGNRYASVLRVARIAAAAAFTFFLGGAVVYKSLEPALQPASAAIVVQRPAAHEEQTTAAHDAWQSEELQEFHGVVDWETWQ